MKKYLSLLVVIAFFSMRFDLPKSLKKNYKFIPSGFAITGEDTVSVQAFYMFDHEVTNAEYSEFLTWLTEHGTEDERELAAIQNENWKTYFKTPMDKFAEFYHMHPVYRVFPVVNVTQQGARLYCKWLEDKINQQLSSHAVRVRLPYHAEVIRAGVGDDLAEVYAWKGPFLQNAKGVFLANFTHISNALMSKNESGELVIQGMNLEPRNEPINTDVIAASLSYYPSQFGVYNLNGNVAEMTMESEVAVGGSWHDYGFDVRLQSVQKYNVSSPMVGFRPVFTVVH